MDRAPIFFSLPTAFVIRNLALGTCLGQVLERRPVVASVHEYALAPLRRLVPDPALTLVAHRPPPESNGRDWQRAAHYLQEGAKRTAGVRVSSAVFSEPRGRLESLGVHLLRATGRGLLRTGLLPRVEARYLRQVSRWPVTEHWRQVLREHRPAVVVSSMLTLANRRASADLPVVVAARDLGLACAALVQSWDNLTSKTATLPAWLDRYWTWSEEMENQLRRLYPHVPAERIVTVGSPQFDYHRRPEMVVPRQEFARRQRLDPARPWVVIGTGTQTLLPDEPRTVVELVEALARAEPTVQVLVRLHPKDDGRRWRELRPRLAERDAVIQSTFGAFHLQGADRAGGADLASPIEFYRQQVNTLHHAAVVACSSSTLTVDAAILDRPVLCLAYDADAGMAKSRDELRRFPLGRARAFSQASHHAPLVATEGVSVCHDRDEAVDAVRRYLRDPSYRREERRRLVAQVTDTPDGGAGERLAAEILALAETSSPARDSSPIGDGQGRRQTTRFT